MRSVRTCKIRAVVLQTFQRAGSEELKAFILFLNASLTCSMSFNFRYESGLFLTSGNLSR